MRSPEASPVSVNTPPENRDELTSLPWLRTWRGVYLFVFGCFVLWVLLLLALTMSYS
ncbi:MAG TPA: hypothetical protein VKU37_02560 [Verrucomicrobiae bacterium]|nr:hypothetical protein [Verrucomicrobiae bacterium]